MIRTTFTLALSVALSAPAAAQTLVADAFGLVPAAQMSGERAAWAGLRLRDGQPEAVEPARPDTVTIFVGPKSLVAGTDIGQAVALATDRHGNLAADGLGARFTLHRDTPLARTRYGVADVLFGPATEAGLFVAGAEISGRQSPRATYRVTADPGSLGPAAILPPGPVTPETVAALATGSLVDRFGNPAEDGTAVTLTLSSPGGATFIPAPVLDGQSRALLLIRDMDGGGDITATVANRTARGPALDIVPMGYGGAVEAHIWPIPDIGALGVRVEPVTTTAGHLLNDGAAIDVIVTDRDGQSRAATGWLRDGSFAATVALDPSGGPFTVSIATPLGTVETEARAGTPAETLRREYAE